jgi:hypothetical protein
MDFRPLADVERRQLIDALRGNAEHDRAILMDRRDTSFLGTSDDVTDEEVITAIKKAAVLLPERWERCAYPHAAWAFPATGWHLKRQNEVSSSASDAS